ncbi:dynamin family protein [Nocardia caishijiensis]|uniref:Replication fork clamp-binding protein CrfC n=1 Tax=Nocardia caishijiensis TaxID=184756 RepID=A0ABQ6YTV9_9NOCA|nr:dynamin family protein [Nocardia caishijiensis]KAF0849240.1 replication fork clamp-binding protein CrfC [Nocardia caishijiensis]
MDALLSALDDTVAAARAAGRDDLVARLETAAVRVRDPRRRIVVAGRLDQGKSRFVNALLGVEICPVGDDSTTRFPMVLAYAPQPRAELVLATASSGEERVEFPIADLATVDHRCAAGKQILRIDVYLPADLLADGIVLIDTPGIGARTTAGTLGVLEMLPAADALLLISDASTELTAPELTFLRQASELCSATAVLMSKTDLYPHWRQVFEADREHLRTANLDLPLLPISALLRAHALRLQDAQLGAESGYGLLYQFLREQVVARDEAATRATISREMSSAAEHLALALGSELVALRDPRQAAAAVAELRSAKTRAQQLHRRTAAWQQTLADGITDLAGDVDHDLRERLREIARTGEEWIDDHDPGRHWGAITEWLTGTVDSALGDNLLWAHARADTLAQRVAEHFHELGSVDLPVLDQSGTAHGTGTLGDLEPDIGVVSKVLVGMRGSYGGVLMVGLATTFAGLALLNPISLGAGMLVGGKAYRDDKQARLTRRRTDAKNAVRRFLDDVAFQAGKDSRDRVHRIHRALRDHYAGIAERSLRSIDESLTAAQEAATSEATHRAQRTAALQNQLTAIAALRTSAAPALAPPSG